MNRTSIGRMHQYNRSWWIYVGPKMVLFCKYSHIKLASTLTFTINQRTNQLVKGNHHRVTYTHAYNPSIMSCLCVCVCEFGLRDFWPMVPKKLTLRPFLLLFCWCSVCDCELSVEESASNQNAYRPIRTLAVFSVASHARFRVRPGARGVGCTAWRCYESEQRHR